MQTRPSSNVLAVVYSDGIAADKIIADWGYALRSAGLTVAGLVQLNTFERDPTKCDMAAEELFSGTVLQLSEYRGSGSRGCRLDHSALVEAAVLLNSALDEMPNILVLNKFGKIEAEGSGLRDVLAKAVELNVPIIVGVPFRNIDQWRAFAGDLAEECPADSSHIERWLVAHGILPETAAGRRTGGSRHLPEIDCKS
ncbi:MAG: DUF2478 domain-containing protein [Pseudolabrys sp.]|nr:DUF2478 domain-containing protein [Pseudolabrys sp.]